MFHVLHILVDKSSVRWNGCYWECTCYHETAASILKKKITLDKLTKFNPLSYPPGASWSPHLKQLIIMFIEWSVIFLVDQLSNSHDLEIHIPDWLTQNTLYVEVYVVIFLKMETKWVLHANNLYDDIHIIAFNGVHNFAWDTRARAQEALENVLQILWSSLTETWDFLGDHVWSAFFGLRCYLFRKIYDKWHVFNHYPPGHEQF